MLRSLSLALCALLLVFISGCGPSTKAKPAPAPPKPAVMVPPATPLAVKKEDLGAPVEWSPQWDAVIERSLPPEMLSERAAHAVRIYCPRFEELPDTDKRAFWAYTFQALAAAEAGLNPTSDVHHTEAAVNRIDPVTHRPARQEGLLQLKYEDAKRYGCPFDWEADRRLPGKDPDRTILQPARNLQCGIKIMDDQIVTQDKPLVSRTSYWATLQPGTRGHLVFARQMRNEPKDCRPERRVRRRIARRHVAAR